MGILDRFRLDDQVVLITGAASGIGEGYAEACADAGAALSLADIDEDGLETVADDLRTTYDARVHTRVTDVADHDQVAALVEAATAELGGLDVAFANAGIGRLSLPIDRYPLDEWDEVLDVNLDGVFYTIREAAGAMEDGGSIVTTASVLGDIASGMPGVGAYVASKGGVVQLTKQAAADLGGRGIRVNAIAPGWTHTSIGGGAFEKDAPGMDEMHERMAEETVLGRLGDPSDLQGVAVFLASDASSYCTGSVFTVDGGWTVT